MIKLEDLIPAPSSFVLKKTGKRYHLRAVSLEDELWMNRTFGDQIQEIFAKIKMQELCRIVFHLLEEEDKEDFAQRKVTIMNEKGEKVSEVIGGAELLMCLIVGLEEKFEIHRALLETVGVSRPMLDKLIAGEEKKSPLPTGHKYSTSSRPSTAGRPRKSKPSRAAKSTGASKRSAKGKTRK